MKFPISMLYDYVQTSLNAEQIGDLLTMATFELEGIEEVEGEPVLDIKVVSNRGDGLSVFGLAREVLAKDADARPTDLYIAAQNRFKMDDESATDARQKTSVKIEASDCKRYACRLFNGVQNGDSPEWLQKRVRQCNQRPISLLVDLTNYVMIELGQPLHAFDFEKLGGQRIIVRKANLGEKLTTLNGDEHELQPNQLMICDANKAVAVAGVMGGQESEVSESTTNVLLESANFENTSVRKTRKQLNLNTEASYRFERSVDPESVVSALNRFAQLLNQIQPGSVIVPGVVDEYPGKPELRSTSVRVSRASKLLGMDVTIEEAKRYLERLGFGVTGDGEPFQVQIPTWRPDITREIDLVEEIGRVHGFERIPDVLPVGTTTLGGLIGITRLKSRIREVMLRSGFHEVVSHALRDVSPLDFRPEYRLNVRNPHSPDMAYLRDSVLPCLADAAKRNGAKDIHLFEVGQVFVKGEVQVDESPELGFISIGALNTTHWSGNKPAEADFYSLKGVIESIAQSLGIAVTFALPRDPDRRFHPSRQSGVLVNEGKLWVGTIGQIHPDVAEEVGLPANTFLGELDLAVLATEKATDPQLKQFSRNPAVRRDMSFAIAKSTEFAEIEAAIRSACGEALEKLWLFDRYEGPGIPDGQHSLSVALQLRKLGENFTDEEANQVRDRAVAALGALGAKSR